MSPQAAAAGALLLLAVAALQGVAGMHILACLNQLEGGQYLQNGEYWLVMQTDCNLVLYKGQLNRGKQLWESATTNRGHGCYATLAGTSRLQVQTSTDVLESYGPNKSVNGNYLVLDTTGNVSIRVLGREDTLWYLNYPPLKDSAPDVVWGGTFNVATEWRAMSSVLYMVAGYVLRPGTALQNGKYNLQISGCGLQLQNGANVWLKGNGGGSNCTLVLQNNGNLQILHQNGSVSWQTNSTGKRSTDSVNSYVLYLSEHGEVAVFDSLQLKSKVWEADWREKKSSWKYILPLLAVVLVVGVLIAMGGWIAALYHGYFSGCAEDSEVSPKSSGSKCRAFSLAEIRRATCCFRDKLGEGGFGQVFYGQLANGQEVAIKNLSAASKQGQTEFLTEINLLSVVHHKYLVSLLGYCTFSLPFLGWKKQLLVYEYMSGGDLHKRLHGSQASSNALTWEERTSIILQIAEGIEYLHHYCKPAIIHRDIKGSNVLLNENMTAKVADFGLSKFVAVEEDASHIFTAVRGTFGYLDPEYCTSNRLTEKSDVYAFGVLLMEILTGTTSSLKTGENQKFLVYRVKDALEFELIQDLADPNLEGVYQRIEFSELVKLSLLCVKERSIDRPSMVEVVQNLRKMGLIHLGSLKSMSTKRELQAVAVDVAENVVFPTSMPLEFPTVESDNSFHSCESA